jgi:hypothetical protein
MLCELICEHVKFCVFYIVYVIEIYNVRTCIKFINTDQKENLCRKYKFHQPMKRGGGKERRQIVMSVAAAFSPSESNWGGRGAAWASLYIYFLWTEYSEYSDDISLLI